MSTVGCKRRRARRWSTTLLPIPSRPLACPSHTHIHARVRSPAKKKKKRKKTLSWHIHPQAEEPPSCHTALLQAQDPRCFALTHSAHTHSALSLSLSLSLSLAHSVLLSHTHTHALMLQHLLSQRGRRGAKRVGGGGRKKEKGDWEHNGWKRERERKGWKTEGGFCREWQIERIHSVFIFQSRRGEDGGYETKVRIK